MKKLVLRLGFLAVLAVVGLALVVRAALGPATRSIVEASGQEALGVETTLQDVLLGLGVGSTRVGLEGLVIQNPSGFDGPAFLNLGEASMRVENRSLLADTIRVPRIDIDGLQLRVVQNGTDSNLLQILQHLHAQLPGDESSGAEESPSDEGGSGRSVAIDAIHLRGIQAEFDLTGVPGIADRWTFAVPDTVVDLTEDGREAIRRDAEEVIARTVDQLVTEAFLAADSELPPAVAEILRGGELSLSGLRARALEVAEAELQQAQEELEGRAREELEDALDEHLPDDLRDQLPAGALDGILGGRGGG